MTRAAIARASQIAVRIKASVALPGKQFSTSRLYGKHEIGESRNSVDRGSVFDRGANIHGPRLSAHMRGTALARCRLRLARQRFRPWRENLTEFRIGRRVHQDAYRECSTVLRRVTALLVIWASLLAAATPALACTLASGSCCPGHATGWCGSPDRELRSDATDTQCCAASPTHSQGVSVAPRRSALVLARVSDSWIPVAMDHWSSTAQDAPAGRPVLISSGLTHRADAALAYLRTGRLRL